MNRYDPAFCSSKRLAYLEIHTPKNPESEEPVTEAPRFEATRCLLCNPQVHFFCARPNMHKRTRGHRVARASSLMARAAARVAKLQASFVPDGAHLSPYK